ncbi:hypothetical protein PsorP6_008074 [Peronosclerospora sorghi]|uniref:Uncharacterized protein n=1 Tax=Peronosclerospora sorghi TaxID=230839 RepID=A0ACC0W8K4_9STRA|nr:hypothetical protein PsorP6_008074 [Peronosclerospora sorghi]
MRDKWIHYLASQVRRREEQAGRLRAMMLARCNEVQQVIMVTRMSIVMTERLLPIDTRTNSIVYTIGREKSHNVLHP